MVFYEHFKLDNGLDVYVHEDKATPMAALNIIYDVGSRDEHEDKTGFAHLFEHLMFGGSKNIDDYDTPLQNVGGENNAFTCPDFTSYYCKLPAINLETAFWLESDRMKSLSFKTKTLEVQRSVVVEEFKQMYLNKPYGDAMLLFRSLAYKNHPYRWATIGKELKHIEDATMDDVKSFFNKFYCPANAKLVVGGNVSVEEVKQLTQKWFGDIPAGQKNERNLPKENEQTEPRRLSVERKVTGDALYLGFPMSARLDDDYYSVDLFSDILGRGSSSRLHQELVKNQKIFSSISAYVLGSAEPGHFMISGKVNEGVDLEYAESKVWEVIDEALKNVSEKELKKVKNQALSSFAFSKIELLDKVMAIANGVILGDPNMINNECDKINNVSLNHVKLLAQKTLKKERSSTLLYKAVS